jgi:hypothetical protein
VSPTITPPTRGGGRQASNVTVQALLSTPPVDGEPLQERGFQGIYLKMGPRSKHQAGFRTRAFSTRARKATGWWLLLLTFLACRLFGSSSGTMNRRGLCWKADVTVTVTARRVLLVAPAAWCGTPGQGSNPAATPILSTCLRLQLQAQLRLVQRSLRIQSIHLIHQSVNSTNALIG